MPHPHDEFFSTNSNPNAEDLEYMLSVLKKMKSDNIQTDKNIDEEISRVEKLLADKK